MTIQRPLALCLALIAAEPAVALSCLRPDAVTQYETARDSAEVYTLVVGTITSDRSIAIPEGDPLGDGSISNFADTNVRLTGRMLTPTGFTETFDRDVIVRATCISAWCPNPPERGRDVFAALKHNQDELLLEISACPSNALRWTADDEARVLNCHRFENCVTAN